MKIKQLKEKTAQGLKDFLPKIELSDIGTPEDLVFTLEDGSTVTKSIRVISTTTSQAEA